MDPGRNATDEAVGEPLVRVDDKQLRMAQASDGNWYAYFGDESATDDANGKMANQDFGIDDDLQNITISADDALLNATVIVNAPALSNWNSTIPGQHNGTVADSVYGIGQISIVDDDYGRDVGTIRGAEATFGGQEHFQNYKEWPFIQQYEFVGGETFDVILEQAGADEVVTLNYDTMEDYSGLV